MGSGNPLDEGAAAQVGQELSHVSVCLDRGDAEGVDQVGAEIRNRHHIGEGHPQHSSRTIQIEVGAGLHLQDEYFIIDFAPDDAFPLDLEPSIALEIQCRR